MIPHTCFWGRAQCVACADESGLTALRAERDQLRAEVERLRDVVLQAAQDTGRALALKPNATLARLLDDMATDLWGAVPEGEPRAATPNDNQREKP